MENEIKESLSRIEQSLSMLKKKIDETNSSPPYESKNGFVKVPLIRGFDVIKPLYDFLENVKKETGKDCFICGGYARYCASPNREPIKADDVDIYCEDESVFNHVVNELAKFGLSIKHENDMSITYQVDNNGLFKYVPVIQLIKPMKEARIVSFGDKETILKNFDFTIVRAAILSEKEVLVDADFMHDEQDLILRLKNIHCPISSTLRCMKYSAKGYWLKPLECMKLFLDWDSRDDNYRQTLIDFIDKASKEDGLSKEQIFQMESMMRID